MPISRAPSISEDASPRLSSPSLWLANLWDRDQLEAGSYGDGAPATLAESLKVEICDAEATRDAVTPSGPDRTNLERLGPRSIQG
eukprot:7420955-Pyramimonas_sp.AAC.1